MIKDKDKDNDTDTILLDLNNIRGMHRSHVVIKQDKLGDDPIKTSCDWINSALNLDLINPNSAILSSVNIDKNNNIKPNSRIILIKEITNKGYIFYTHYNSVKGLELENNNNICLLFYWDQTARQIRISGKIKKISPEKSDEYFHSRPRGSQISACISNQSQPISSKQDLDDKMSKLSDDLKDKDIIRPQTWGGYIIIPEQIEFWQGQQDRLHDRILFSLDPETKTWNKTRLEP